jgi:uncharacterized protein YdeI (YjbR/CyaY-like superfamily)
MPEPRAVPKTFRSPEAFRAWLERHHERASELLVRCFKTKAGHRGLTYEQALQEALCFGWIDGVRRAYDDDSFTHRFSPRRAKSAWSAPNLARVAKLKAEGRMRPAGLAALARGTKSAYSYESRPRTLPPAFLKVLRANAAAWRYYQERPPGYRRLVAFWIMSAKQAETRERRLAGLVEACARGQHVGTLQPGKKR